MKELSKEQIESILEDPEKVQEAGIKPKDPWWMILLKIIAYALALLTGGAVVSSCM